METTYYTLYTRESGMGIAQASGEDRLVMFTRTPKPQKLSRREDNVISLDRYREQLAARQEVSEEAEEPPERRARTDHSRDRLQLLELAACAAIICVAAAACVMLLL